MEHGFFTDNSAATFSLTDEDHTIANAVRFTLNQDPRVTFCGYSIPHPSKARVNIRVQTTGGTVFDASQYAFFGNDVLEEVELGGLDDEDEDLPAAGLDEEEFLFDQEEVNILVSFSFFSCFDCSCKFLLHSTTSDYLIGK
ncbi:hypothetical protein ES332_A03G125600v1 [Gossypium tomentosum]|uniref:DNA-directed RNA polymerase RBP11-like dimerisation domain-containing protein n=1 Tax=Gossypium tomentosum TaxID=34277 RepID=A0A5D2R7C8_GOSTO|nr:hypothetical protein ES332_A03G125600v1 [Gossypium tomentosum]